MTPPTFLDLFCGCGGFTLGMIRSGFRCLAAVDSDRVAIETLESNFAAYDAGVPSIDHIVQADLTKLQPQQLAKLIGSRSVDVIVGGPPCQGFSTARMVDGANHGERIKRDSRRYLYRHFLRFVAYFRPRIFVMENVPGLRSAAGGAFFTRVQNEARSLRKSAKRARYRVHAQVEDAFELGSPQKRKRQLIIGVRTDLTGYFIPELRIPARAVRHPSLGLAISDLPVLRAGGGMDDSEYDLRRRSRHFAKYGARARKYLSEVLEVRSAEKLTNHTARPHSKRDLRDFSKLREGEHAASAMRNRGVRFEFPYDKSIFKDRYTRQSRRNPCSTIVAHLSKDGLMFIHPTQNRSLTPREAARVQTFPDWFRFPASRTPAFRLIGNAVPPVVGEAVGDAVGRFLAHATSKESNATKFSVSFKEKMREHIIRLWKLSPTRLRLVSREDFLLGWYALLVLLPNLHPESALDHGSTTEQWSGWELVLPGIRRRSQRRYVRSGWPIVFSAIAREAWRRFESGDLKQEEIYGTDIVTKIIEKGTELQTA